MPVSNYPDHALKCKHLEGDGFQGRHARVKYAILAFCKSTPAIRSKIAVINEPVLTDYYTAKPGYEQVTSIFDIGDQPANGKTSNFRGDIAFITPEPASRVYITDTVIRFAESDRVMASGDGEQTVRAGVQQKMEFYGKRSQMPAAVTIPLSFNQYGRLNDAGVKFIKQVVKIAAGDDKTLRSFLVRRYYEALSLALLRAITQQVTAYLSRCLKA